jgi:glycosyltransferase involved in cell wall biosynthesis
MRIGIDVGVEPGIYGGVATALGSLISALGELTDGPEEYLVIAHPHISTDWLRPLMGPNQRFAVLPTPVKRSIVRRAVSPFTRRLRAWLSPPRRWPEVAVSDGFYESLNCDVIHFPTQFGFAVCAVPTVYNPHDLQHLHYPQFFTPSELAQRETIYPAACHFSQAVIVNSQWIKDDVVKSYAISPDKIQIIPEAAPTQFVRDVPEQEIEEVKARYGLNSGFAFYPAATWPHKNHQRLLEALAYLRDRRGIVLPLVCTGARHDASWSRLQSRVVELNLRDQVSFLGFVPPEHLRALYHLARCLVLPSLFEANSLPIFEAWLEGTPVACSNVTALPEQLMDAGLLFDPLDPMAIGDALAKLVTDGALCEELREKGRHRLRDFDWARTAKAYRAIYRRTAGSRLVEEERLLLSWDWMRYPRGPAVPAADE